MRLIKAEIYEFGAKKKTVFKADNINHCIEETSVNFNMDGEVDEYEVIYISFENGSHIEVLKTDDLCKQLGLS